MAKPGNFGFRQTGRVTSHYVTVLVICKALGGKQNYPINQDETTVMWSVREAHTDESKATNMLVRTHLRFLLTNGVTP
jgi:hypothetical protein